ncbi:MAG: hypothetical protein AAGF92_07250 [Myxococcota bacterium]
MTDEERRDRFNNPITNALYYSFVDSARKKAGESDFSIKDMPELVSRLVSESETAQVLIYSAHLEDRIRYLIKSHLYEIESNRDEQAIFGSNGPLGSFASRILMRRHLGWITPATTMNLESWRKIRNEFAHRAYRTSFESQKIKDLWSQTREGDHPPGWDSAVPGNLSHPHWAVPLPPHPR